MPDVLWRLIKPKRGGRRGTSQKINFTTARLEQGFLSIAELFILESRPFRFFRKFTARTKPFWLKGLSIDSVPAPGDRGESVDRTPFVLPCAPALLDTVLPCALELCGCCVQVRCSGPRLLRFVFSKSPAWGAGVFPW